MLRILHVLFLVLGVYSETLHKKESEVQAITTVYPQITCHRKHSAQIEKTSEKLLSLLLDNPLICSTSGDQYFWMEAKKEAHHKSLYKDIQRGQLDTKYKDQLENRYKRAPSWNNPVGLPIGTSITYCDGGSCCIQKKTLRKNGLYYSSCRECKHQILLPGSYTPRDHTHVTCQDTDFSETCFSGEGGCVTNMVTKTVQNKTGSTNIILGQSCSCEIRSDSIFTKYLN